MILIPSVPEVIVVVALVDIEAVVGSVIGNGVEVTSPVSVMEGAGIVPDDENNVNTGERDVTSSSCELETAAN